MPDFSGLDALIAKKQGGDAPAPVSTPEPATTSAPSGGGHFSGLDSLIAKKSGPEAHDSSNPIVGGMQKAGRGLGSALGNVSNALDLPLAAGEAMVAGRNFDQLKKDLSEGGGWGNVSGALSNVAENDVYFRKGSLQRVADDPAANAQQKSQAQYLLAHPWVAAAGDFATEFANPSNLIMGGVGKVAGAVSHIPQVAQSIDEAQAATRIGSRFAGVKAGARDVYMRAHPDATNAEIHQAAQAAEQWGRGLVNKGHLADEESYHQTMTDFGGLTKPQQEEVIHRMQGNRVADFGTQDAMIDKRAEQLGKQMWLITRDQMKGGTIDPAKVYGKEEMFPGVFADVSEGTTRRGLAPGESDAIAKYARGEAPDADEFSPLVKERGDMLKEQLAKDEPPSKKITFFPMKGAFNEPGRDEEYLEYLQHHAGSGTGKTAERKGSAGVNAPRRTFDTLLDAQKGSARGLRPDWSPAESYYRFLAQRKQNVALEESMHDLLGMGLAKPENERQIGDHFANVGDVAAARMFGSPTLKETAAHQHVVNFLEEVGATKGEASSFASATSSLGKVAQSIGGVYGGTQSILRQAVISNPIVHAGWNLMGQYLAAGGDVRHLAGVGKAMEEDAARMGAITSRGAPKSLSGGSAIALASRPGSDLNLGEKLQRGAASAQEWNAKVVFDQAEKRYSSALYRTFTERGMSAQEAGNRVRQALGDYANVSNAGMDAALKKAFFFYPWLKTILPFWIKTGATKPQTWNPLTAGIATQNEGAGDPNAGTSSESPFTLYTGTKDGRPQYYSVPVVSRILGQIGDLVGGALTNNRQEASKGFKSLLLNRLNPIVGGAVGAGQQIVSGTDQPEGPLGYAPVLERLRSGIVGLGDFVPAPVKAAYDAAQVLLGHEDLKPSVIAGELVGGTGYVSTTPTQKRVAAHISARFYHYIDAALKRGDKAAAWKGYQMMQQSLQRAGLAHDQQKRNPEKADETNPNPVRAPEGAQPLEATETPQQ